jgi:parvulin-like peptidyl-prolyl isomerase
MVAGCRVPGFTAFAWAGFALAPFLAPTALADAPKALPATVSADPNRRVVAFIHSNIPVYRDELGEYLLARGGMDKIELLVNRRMLEVAATRAGVSVTPDEIRAGLEDDLRGVKVDLPAFTQVIRERYGKSIFEWEQDVIRPRLLIGKMCHKNITITPEEMQKTFESKFGEKREAQLIVWPKANGVPQLTDEQKAKARGSLEEFEKLASNQPDPGLQQSRGRVNPVGRHIDGEDPKVEEALFSLKENEISPWIETKANFTCVRCVRILPADPSITLDKVKLEVEKEVYDRKLNAAIPEMFAEIRKKADPKLTVHVPKPEVADPMNPPIRVEHPDPRVLAIVYGTIPITREDLGDFVIVRGGFEKVELFVNKRIIEVECAKRGITLDAKEIETAKVEYVKKLGIANVTVADFVKHVLPKRNLTEHTWVEDVIKPELAMAKMSRERVKVTEEDLQKAFENEYGEKRTAKIILWRREEARVALKQWDELRKSDQEFERIARSQFDPNLASAGGRVAPIGRYPDADNPKIAEVVFSLNEGEVSQLFETPAGIMCVKCTGKVPPVADASLDRVRQTLEKDVFERKLSRELGVLFGEMKLAANPNILLRGPTTTREFEEGNRQLIQQAVGTQPK